MDIDLSENNNENILHGMRIYQIYKTGRNEVVALKGLNFIFFLSKNIIKGQTGGP